MKSRSLVCWTGSVFAAISIIKVLMFQATSLSNWFLGQSSVFLDESSVVVRLRICCTAFGAEAFGSVARMCRILNPWVGIRSRSWFSMIIWRLEKSKEGRIKQDGVPRTARNYIHPSSTALWRELRTGPILQPREKSDYSYSYN